MTVEAAGERYMAHLKRAGRKRSTIAAVESALRVHLVPFFAGKALDAIRHEDVATSHRASKRRGLKPKSIRNYVGTLSALFNYARGPQRRWAAVNPCDGVELPGVPERRGDPVPRRSGVGGRAPPCRRARTRRSTGRST